MLYTVISITTVIQYNTITGRLCCFGYERFISFWLWFFDTRRERHNSYYADHAMLIIPNARRILWYLWSMSEEIRKKLDSSTRWSNLNSQVTLFQKPQILRTISSGHDVIPTPAPFPVGRLLRLWWLSYPLRASVKLYPMTMHLNS